MTQAYVIRNDLVVESAENPVRVRASYNDVSLPIGFAGSDCTVLTVDPQLIIQDRMNFRAILASNWRQNFASVLNAEAGRRIELVFPEFKQRNYTARYQTDITSYGADPTAWPQAEKDFKTEYDRGWKYVADVRTASNAWTAMPVDPTADSIWPPTISPVQ